MSGNKATHQGPADPLSGPSGVQNVLLWVVQILLAVYFVYSAMMILTNQPGVAALFATIGLGQWFQYLVGALELAGAVGLLIPRLCGLAALGLAGLMAGVVIAHLTVLPPATQALFPAALGLLFVLVSSARWPQTKALLAMLRR